MNKDLENILIFNLFDTAYQEGSYNEENGYFIIKMKMEPQKDFEFASISEKEFISKKELTIASDKDLVKFCQLKNKEELNRALAFKEFIEQKTNELKLSDVYKSQEKYIQNVISYIDTWFTTKGIKPITTKAKIKELEREIELLNNQLEAAQNVAKEAVEGKRKAKQELALTKEGITKDGLLKLIDENRFKSGKKKLTSLKLAKYLRKTRTL